MKECVIQREKGEFTKLEERKRPKIQNGVRKCEYGNRVLLCGQCCYDVREANAIEANFC